MVLGTYEVLFQWLAFRRNHTQTHLRRSWPFHLTRKRGIGKTPSTSLACDVSLLACDFLSASTAFFASFFPSPSQRQQSVLTGLEVLPRAGPMLSVTSRGLGSPRGWGGRAEPRGRRSPDFGVQDGVRDGSATSLALSPKPSPAASGTRPRPAPARRLCAPAGLGDLASRSPVPLGARALTTREESIIKGKKNSCGSPPAGPFWIWVKPRDPVHAPRV